VSKRRNNSLTSWRNFQTFAMRCETICENR
jgi:hypothetical protein